MNQLEIRRLSKSFGPVRAVDVVSFAVGPGQIYGLLGPNGAGKSTTISMGCALMHRLPLLLLDEPTVGIDVQARMSILEFIRGLTYQGAPSSASAGNNRSL